MEREALKLALETLQFYASVCNEDGQLTPAKTAIAKCKAALAQPVQEPDDLRLHQWTATKKDLSDYICVGLLTLAGIEDGEYGQSEINSFENTIEALQERLVTGSEHKEVPLLAYIGGLNTTPPLLVQRQWVGLTDEDINAIPFRALEIGVTESFKEFSRAIEAKLKEKNNGT